MTPGERSSRWGGAVEVLLGELDHHDVDDDHRDQECEEGGGQCGEAEDVREQ